MHTSSVDKYASPPCLYQPAHFYGDHPSVTTLWTKKGFVFTDTYSTLRTMDMLHDPKPLLNDHSPPKPQKEQEPRPFT